MMTPAIFLSYAAQDADAARRICAALRALGLEVWFDQSQLRGGDAWDASMRKQIRECALFVPIISDNTNAREEGYFLLEWKLAVDRSHLMADSKAFFFPVALGDVSEPAALVPDKFRERQWPRLNDDVSISAFAERVAKVQDYAQAGSASSSKNAPSRASNNEFGLQGDTPKTVAPFQNGVQVSSSSRERTNLDTDLRPTEVPFRDVGMTALGRLQQTQLTRRNEWGNHKAKLPPSPCPPSPSSAPSRTLSGCAMSRAIWR